MARTKKSLKQQGAAKRLVVSLDDHARTRLDELSRDLGLPRAEIVRRLISLPSYFDVARTARQQEGSEG